MKDMLLVLMERLMNVHENTWYEVADTTSYPYVVFNVLPLSEMEQDRQENILEIDVWDRTTNPLALEELTSLIDNSLKDWQHLDDGQLFWLERISRGGIPDPDPNIRRRQIRYRIKRYER